MYAAMYTCMLADMCIEICIDMYRWTSAECAVSHVCHTPCHQPYTDVQIAKLLNMSIEAAETNEVPNAQAQVQTQVRVGVCRHTGMHMCRHWQQTRFKKT